MKTYSLEKVRAHRDATPRYRKIYYALYRSLRKLRRLPREVKWVWQRGRRGWAECDSWSADEYLDRVFIGILNNLIECNCGHPTRLAEQEWLDILAQMRDGFIAAQEFRYSVKREEQRNLDLARFEAGMKLVTEYWFDLWD
jgi:hypothetical protein